MECLLCRVYVHDTIESSPSHPFVRDSIRKHAAKLTPEFMRLLRHQDTMAPLAFLAIELGIVKRIGQVRLNPLYIAADWINEQRRLIGDLHLIHYQHSKPSLESTDDLYS